ncbi:MAG: helix-turn-helix transcriptional regulator [Actinobacteria bacterium]|nr:helix-turn-helix transcriptional regulator [Actinomycetota bacterium]
MRAFLTQAEIAERSGINQSSISRWERGEREPTFHDVMRVIGAAGFRMSIQLHSAAKERTRGALWIDQLHERDAASELVRVRKFKVSRTRRYVPYSTSTKGPHIDRHRRWMLVRQSGRSSKFGGVL